MSTQGGVHGRVEAYVLALGAAALVSVFASVVLLARAPPAPLAALVGSVAFVASFLALERFAVPFVWRGHRVTTALTEMAAYVGYVALSPLLVVVLLPIARGIAHFATGRAPVKGIFNMSHATVGAAVGAGAYLAAIDAGAAPWVAGVAATLAYSLVSEVLVAVLFAIMERTGVARTYAERFLPANVLSCASGLHAGVGLLGLWALHPAALLAGIPLLALLLRHARLQASSEREVEVRRRLAEDAVRLIGTQDEEQVATRVVGACRDLLHASRVRLRLEARVWEDAWDGAAALREHMRAPVVGREGRVIGALEVLERPMRARSSEDGRALLHILASHAASGFESATALREVAAQRDVIARQEKLSSLGALLAGVAHEVNNPLSYMKLRLHVMRQDAARLAERPGAQEARRHAQRSLASLDVLHKGVERLAALSHSLKVAARPGNGQRAPTDANEVVQQVVTILHAAERQVAFDVRLAEDAPHVHANAAELHQVVLNLVKNAAEALHGRDDARIRVETRAAADGVRILVTDNGPGVPPHVQPRLFSPFFTTKENGTGLGLSISHQIVTAHGGEIAFETTPGGTTFVVRLPLAAPAPRQASR